MNTVPRAQIALLLIIAAITPGKDLTAHEFRPAYLEIKECAQNRFDVLWKQPNYGIEIAPLELKLSNGLIDTSPDEQYSSDNFTVQRWTGLQFLRNSFDGATLQINGLDRTPTDTLVDIHFANGRTIQTLISPGRPALTIRLTETSNVAVRAYLTLGIKHILTGIDHLAFVLGLTLLVTNRATLAKTLTAFTLAHSITLSATTLHAITVSSAMIEALVALSIIFVAVELTRSYGGKISLTARVPWLTAFIVGLLHGCAFAGSLAQIGLPPNAIGASLFLFNAGVELGQLAFVAVIFSVGFVIQRFATKQPAWVRWVPPYAIGSLSCLFFFERLSAALNY